jgi:hypothetical protein
MGTVYDFKEVQAKLKDTNKPRQITFYSPKFTKNNQDVSAAITVHVENGDVLGIMDVVIENGGLWNEERNAFLPWPCAWLEIEDER